MVILAGLVAVLGGHGTVLGRSWGGLGAVLGFLVDFWRPRGRAHRFDMSARRAQARRLGPPPLPKLLAKAKSDTIMSILAN